MCCVLRLVQTAVPEEAAAPGFRADRGGAGQRVPPH